MWGQMGYITCILPSYSLLSARQPHLWFAARRLTGSRFKPKMTDNISSISTLPSFTMRKACGRVAQWISASDFGSEGRGFDPHRVHFLLP